MKKMLFLLAAILLLPIGLFAAEDPMSPEAKKAWDRGYELSQKGQFLEAIKEYERGVALSPKAPEIWNEYAIALRNVNRLNASLKAGWAAIELAPGEWSCYNSQANSFLQAQAWPQSMQCYQRAAELNPDKAWSARNWLHFGYEAWRNGLTKEAGEAFKKAAELDPSNGLAFVDLGALTATVDPAKREEGKKMIEKGIGLLKKSGKDESKVYAKSKLDMISDGKPATPEWTPSVSRTEVLPAFLKQPALGSVQSITIPPTATRVYDLAEKDSVSLTTPENWWEYLSEKNPSPSLFTVGFKPPDTKAFYIMMSAHYPSDKDLDVKKGAEFMMQSVLPSAVEQDPKLIPIEGGSCKGYAFIVTDKKFKEMKAKDGEYPYMLVVLVQAGKILCNATVFTEDNSEAFISRTLDCFKTLSYRGPKG